MLSWASVPFLNIFCDLLLRWMALPKTVQDWEREASGNRVFFWWKWQWHRAYCLVKHTVPLPHAAWPSNRGQWNCSLGWAEMLSFCCCHTQKIGPLQSQALPPLPYSSCGSSDTGDENLCCCIKLPKQMWHAISPGMSTNCDFIELYIPWITFSQRCIQQGG